MPVGDDGPQRRCDAAHELGALLLAVEFQHRLEPFVVGSVDRDLSRPLLTLREFLVAPGQLRRFHLVGVVGGGVVVGVHAPPALIRIARRRRDVLRLRWLIGCQHLRRHLVDGRGLHDVVGLLPGTKLDPHARHQDGIRRTHVCDRNTGRVGELLEQGQSFLLVGGGVDNERALALCGRKERRIEPGALAAR